MTDGHPEFLAGEGEMVRRVREFDWSKTPVGPVGTWPGSLRTAVSLCLASHFQIIIFWTRELLQIYNDPFLTILGGKHPASLGQRARECWAEMWEGIQPLYDHVFATGTATRSDNIRLPVNRHGYLEESFYTMSYTPILLEEGGVGGVFNVVLETTQQIVAERRTRLLRDLAARTAEAQTITSACILAAEVFAKSEDIRFSQIFLFEPGEKLALASSSGIDSAALAKTDPARSVESGELWPLAEVSQTHRPVVVDDVIAKCGQIASGPWGHPVERAVLLPLARPGQERLSGVLVAGVTPQRALDDDFRDFLSLVAGQTATAIGNVRAYEEERARAESLAMLDRAKTASARAGEEARTEGLRAGADDYLVKPFSARELLARVEGTVAIAEVRREADRRYGNLLAASPDAIFVWRLDSGIEAWNHGAQDLYGFSAEEARGQKPHQLLQGEAAMPWPSIEAALRKHGHWDGDLVHWTKDGRSVTVSARLLLAVGDDGIERILESNRDITERKRAEEALRANERLYRAIGESIDFGVWVCAPDGRNTYASESFLKLVGLTQEQCSNLGWGDRLHPDDAERAIAAWKECVRTGSNWDIEHRFRGVDGHWHPVLTRGVPVRDERGEITCWAGINLDISNLKHTQEDLRDAKQRLESLLENSPLAVIEWSSVDYRIVRWSGEAVKVFGWTAEETVGKRIHELNWIFPDDQHLVTQVMADMLSGRRPRNVSKNRNVRKDGTVIHCEWYNSTLFDPSGRFSVLSLVLDVTDRMRAEEELREADRRKSEFLGILSHELRNPLTPIRNGLYILDRAKPGGEQAQRAHSVIDRQVGHLARLVDDLLDVTRITRGKIRLQRSRLDLVDLVRRSIEDHRSLLQNHEVAVDLPSEAIWINGDPTRLVQVVGNLLNNAAKFTPEDGDVSVSLRRTESRAVLEVADTGMGIDLETHKRLFEPFAQADRSLDRSRGGLGLGLALVKGMVELHGGRVSAHSDGPGTGARFIIELPLEDRRFLGAGSPQSQVAATRRRKVLLIEDNMDAADSLSEVLELSGHGVAVAYSGDAGVAKALEFRPEIVLCDIGLPGGTDGYAVAGALRREPATASAYLVALSGYAQPEDQRRALRAGFDAHLAKPPDLQALELLLNQAPVRGALAGDGAAGP